MSDERKDEEMIYGLTADERDALGQGLRTLPETMPPRVVWERIQAQAEAEGLLKQETPKTRSWYAGSGIAAAILLAIVFTVSQDGVAPPPDSMTVPQNLPTNDNQVTGLQALMVESRRLEADLRALPASPRVQQAGTVATIAELQDRIAVIDYQLNDPDSQLSGEQKETYWRERVRLMKLLVGLRYAQAQRTAL